MLAVSLAQVGDEKIFGAKAVNLARLINAGYRVPQGIAIPAQLYLNYVLERGMSGRIAYELSRKKIRDMRWEEMWDASLRIKNLFLKTPLPVDIVDDIKQSVQKIIGVDNRLVVRSAALHEDSMEHSAAGIYDSVINVGIDDLNISIRKVWASLWSDRAFLYLNDSGVRVEDRAMAVIIQAFEEGECSGVCFSESPDNDEHMMIEAVRGLNESFVDGKIEPERWVIDRDNAIVVDYNPGENNKITVAGKMDGTVIKDIKGKKSNVLSDFYCSEIVETVFHIEQLCSYAVDVEWTFRNDDLYILQVRPVTASEKKDIGSRAWYRSLRRSFENLKSLHEYIESCFVPEIEKETAVMISDEPSGLERKELHDSFEKRVDFYERKREEYYAYCVPFAHGMRLFGEIYNERVQPDDPYEFMEVLKGEELLSRSRNEHIRKRDIRNLTEELGLSRGINMQLVEKFLHEYKTNAKSSVCGETQKKNFYEQKFIGTFEETEIEFAKELMSLARESYRWRDDDNIYMGRIQRECDRFEYHVRNVLKLAPGKYRSEDLLRALNEDGFIPQPEKKEKEETFLQFVSVRQLRGQPASKGIAQGKARVIRDERDLLRVKKGEVLVCDAVEPNMTFVVPLVAGIVERRGGMLIHGAIIAREYGVPCVTGIPSAAEVIKTGDKITIDGFEGVVINNSIGKI